MKIHYNFKSIVAIGNFNPAIITPEFLNEVCELDLGEPTGMSPPGIPVARQVKFQNLIFDVNIDRFQLREITPENIIETRILDVFEEIYEILPYTPLNLVGVNINCDLVPQSRDEFQEIIGRLSNPETYFSYFGVSEIDITERFLQSSDVKNWISSNNRIENVKGLVRLINAVKKKDSIEVNYNYEAGPLTKDKTKLDLLLKNHQDFCEEFLSFVKNIEE